MASAAALMVVQMITIVNELRVEVKWFLLTNFYSLDLNHSKQYLLFSFVYTDTHQVQHFYISVDEIEDQKRSIKSCVETGKN